MTIRRRAVIGVLGAYGAAIWFLGVWLSALGEGTMLAYATAGSPVTVTRDSAQPFLGMFAVPAYWMLLGYAATSGSRWVGVVLLALHYVAIPLAVVSNLETETVGGDLLLITHLARWLVVLAVSVYLSGQAFVWLLLLRYPQEHG